MITCILRPEQRRRFENLRIGSTTQIKGVM